MNADRERFEPATIDSRQHLRRECDRCLLFHTTIGRSEGMPDEMTFPLNLPADLPKNRLSFRRRIGGFGDGAADHDVAGARGNSFGSGDHANLIGYAAPGGTDPRGHDGESVSEFRAQSRGFAGGGDYALAAIGQRDSGEAYDAVLDRAPKSDRFQVAAVHAGENGD